MVVPLILTFLKKFIGDKGLNASSLSSLLAGQGPNLQGALDSRITGALGFAAPPHSSADSVGRPRTRRSVPVHACKRRRRGGEHRGRRDDGNRVGAVALAALADRGGRICCFCGTCSAASRPRLRHRPRHRRRQLSAPAAAPALVAISLPAKVYFEVGAAAVGADGSKTIAAVADMIKKDNLKVTITGYTDKTGDVAKNEELAKNRAAAVRDALKAAGVAEANVEMKPPLFVETGAGGSDAEARRVEISKQ